MKYFSKFLLSALILFLCFSVLGVVGYFLKNKDIRQADLAGSISTASISSTNIKDNTEVIESDKSEKKFNILIIPGHNPKDGGANYKDIYERDLVVDVANKISDILNKEGNYNIIVARDKNDWNPILLKYFNDKKQEIIDWKNQKQTEYKNQMNSGKIKYVPDSANHGQASQDAAVRLYGMNKWANENNVDLVLNLHFNDEIRPNMSAPGDLKGFDIFIPESQMKNSAVSRIVAQKIFNELEKIENPEINNLLEDQTLIALGASETLNPPSMLIEYGYIFEKQLLNVNDKEKAINKYAQQTALGIEDYIKSLNDEN